jgi:hypothetical protein
VTVPFDLPQPAAAVIITALTIAVAYLATVDWIHQDARHKTPEQ